jgi:hypothetical protein
VLILDGFPQRLPELLAMCVTIPRRILLWYRCCCHDPTRWLSATRIFLWQPQWAGACRLQIFPQPAISRAMRPQDRPAAEERSWAHISASRVSRQVDLRQLIFPLALNGVATAASADDMYCCARGRSSPSFQLSRRPRYGMLPGLWTSVR